MQMGSSIRRPSYRVIGVEVTDFEVIKLNSTSYVLKYL